MIINFLKHPYFYVSLVIVFFLIQTLIMKRILGIGIINPVILTNLSIASSISYLALLNLVGKINQYDFIVLMSSHFIFLFGILYGIFIVNYFLKFKISGNVSESNLKYLKLSLKNKTDGKIYLLLLFVVCIYKLWFGYMLLNKFGGGDARLELAKSVRSLDIIFGGIENAITLITVLNITYKKSLRNILCMLIVVFISGLTGSKSSIIGILIYYVFFDIIINKRKVFTKRNFYFLILSIFSIFILQIVWAGSSNIYGPLIRFLAAGDVYEYAFVGGDYRDLLEFYNPVRYLLHPFTSVIGIRGYEYPLGSMLVGTTGLPIGATGPNSQLLLLNLVLFNKNLILVFISTFFVGVSISFMMNLGFFSLFYNKKNIFYKSTSFFVFFVVPINIYFDIGLFQMHLVKSFVFLIIVFVIRNFLKFIK